MGVLDVNRNQIVNGGLISASFVSDIYDVLTGNSIQDIAITGSLTVTGSLIGDLTGTAATASYVELSQTSSFSAYAVSSSYMSGSHVISNSGSYNYLVVNEEFILSGSILLYTGSLPTSDPNTSGQLWRSGSYLMISTGSSI